MRLKFDTLALLTALLSLMLGARDWIWYYLKPLPRLDKIAIVLIVSLFIVAALLSGTGLLAPLLSLFFNIHFDE